MRIKPVITTVVGIAIAAGSVLYTKEYLLVEPKAVSEGTNSNLVDIYVARAEIAFGQTIEPHMVSIHPWPREALPMGAFTDIAQLIPEDRSQLRRAKGRFFPGEVVIATKVSHFGEKVTLVQKLGENTRAMAIKVDAVTAVGGFVTPGDHIDILLTQGSKQELSAVTILQKIRVIGVDQQSEESKDQPEVARTITVEVTPEQGQRLALAQRAGTLSLTLRTLEGVVDKPMEMVRLRDLLQEEGPVEKALVQPTVTVRRGTNSEVVNIRRTSPVDDPLVAPAATPEAQPTSEAAPSAVPTQTLPGAVAAQDANLEAAVGLKPRALPQALRPVQPITLTQTLDQ